MTRALEARPGDIVFFHSARVDEFVDELAVQRGSSGFPPDVAAE